MNNEVTRYGFGTACSIIALLISVHLGGSMLAIVCSLMLTIGNGGALYDTLEERRKRKKKDGN